MDPPNRRSPCGIFRRLHSTLQQLGWWGPEVALFGVLLACVAAHGLWNTATLLTLIALTVCLARVIQTSYLCWRLQRNSAPATREDANANHYRTETRVALAAAAMLAIQMVLSPLTPALLWEYRLTPLVALALAVAFQLAGSPRQELNNLMGHSSFSAGSAWLFFLGYLDIICGEAGIPFKTRVEDYMSSNGITDERSRSEEFFFRRMFILVPMRRECMLSDKSFQENDPNVEKEKKLKAVDWTGRTTRPYGETQVYRVKYKGQTYRVAMEEASPLRTAANAVEDTTAEFDEKEFEEFAQRFLQAMRDLLRYKPVIADQIELVKVDDPSQLAKTVVEHGLRRIRRAPPPPPPTVPVTQRLAEGGLDAVAFPGTT